MSTEKRSIDCSSYVRHPNGHIDVKATDKPVKLFLPRLTSKSTDGVIVSKNGSCAVNLMGHEGTKINGVPIMIIGLNVPSSTVKLYFDGENWKVM